MPTEALVLEKRNTILKKFLVFTLLITLTMQSFYRVMMAVDYQIHLPEYLAKCINKAKPQLQCNGQCELMKQVREREQKEAQQSFAKYEFSTLYLHKEQLLMPAFVAVSIQDSDPNFPIIPAVIFRDGDPVFRPPIV